MRDWRWEMVRAGGKTPSASCFKVMRPETRDTYSPYSSRDIWPPRIEACNFRAHISEYDSSDDERYEWTAPMMSVFETVIIVVDAGKRRVRRRYRLRKDDGNQNSKFKKLQTKMEASTAKLWWQCEPCQA